MEKYNFKGMTLVSLVVSIIVLLILSGVSLNMISGENGIINQAIDAKLMTELSNDLFDMESDITSIRIINLGRKLKITELIDGLVNNGTGKYGVSDMTGMHTSDISLSNTRTNPNIAYTGDVYIDNYKRGKIELADIKNRIDIPSLGYGDFAITVNDGSIFYDDDKDECSIISTEDHPVLWVNQDSEIMAFAQTLKFVPYGLLENYEISQLDIFNIDDAFQNIYSNCNNRYVFSVTFDYRKEPNDIYRLEAFAYHFTKNVEFNVGEKSLTIGGMKVQRAGILYGKTQEELETLIENIKENYDGKIPAAALNAPGGASLSFTANGSFDSANKTGVFSCGDNGQMDSWLYEIKKEDLNFNEETGRVYYTPFILYQRWQEVNGVGGYNPMLSVGTANYMSYIEL